MIPCKSEPMNPVCLELCNLM